MDQSAGLTAAEVLNTYDAASSRPCCVTSARSGSPARSPARSSASATESRSALRPSRRAAQEGRPGRVAEERRPPRQADLPGPAHRGQRELSVWAAALPRAIDALGVGGRIAVLSYHSLEDRITKQVLAAGAKGSSPQGLPVELPEHAAYLRLLTRGAEEASPEEQAANPRSASVRLRAAERTRPTHKAVGTTSTSSTKGTHR